MFKPLLVIPPARSLAGMRGAGHPDPLWQDDLEKRFAHRAVRMRSPLFGQRARARLCRAQ